MREPEPDVDLWVAALRGPAAPARPPDVRAIERWRRARLGAGAGLALAAAILLAVVAIQGEPASLALRGAEELPSVELQLVMSDGTVARRLDRSAAYEVGQIAYLRVAASELAEVEVWVEGPDGVEPIARRTEGPEASPLGTEDGYVVYEFERPGSYRFRASDAGRSCPPERCDQVVVEIR